MALGYSKTFLLCFLSLVFFSVVCGDISTGNALWALDFGGKSFVKLPYDFSFDLNPTFTFEAWINCPHPNDDTYKPIVSRGTGTHNKDTDFVLLIGKEGGLIFLMGNGLVTSEYGMLIQAGFLQPNVWYHLAFSVTTKRYESNPNMAVLYLNGRRAGESSWGSGTRQLHPERSILLGTFGNQEGLHYFTGLMDEIRFWDEERSQLNLRKYLNFPLLGNENNLRVYYDCNTKHSSSLLDRTVHHYDGQITQGPFAIQWIPSTLKLHFAEYVWRRGKRSVEEEREEGEGEVNEGESEVQQTGAQAQQRRMRRRQQRQQRQQPEVKTLALRPNKSPFPLNNFTYIIETLPELGNIAVGYNNRIIRSTDLPYPLDYPSVQYLIPEGQSGVTFFRFYGMERAVQEGEGVMREKESTVFYLKVGEPSVCSDKDGCAEKCKA